MAEAGGKPIVVAVDGSAPGWEAMETALYLVHLLNRPVDAPGHAAPQGRIFRLH
jgi:hypothetical protein